MLKLFQKKNPYDGAARMLYAQALTQTRQARFYTDMGVPDSFDGRFDLLVLHLYLIIERMLEEDKVGQEFNQALFDVTFADMDQTLREMGIGDMGVPKHMRRMMKAFNGRMHAYKLAEQQKSLDAFKQALRKNLYGTCEAVPDEGQDAMMRYVLSVRAALEAQKAGDIMENGVKFTSEGNYE